ncbi:hypothetical protein ACFOG5_15760 [Pedobacter fastidiosus]|uniref:hypothetical protein n=1 Tax=Pedobacter fastidiosus TaxID=2765361 RepID=UPI00361B4A48
MRQPNFKSTAVTYFLIRLLILSLAILIFYNSAGYLLPRNIRDDQFSFVGELSLFLKLTTGFCFVYSLFIFWEFNKFRQKGINNLKNSALTIFIISIVAFLASLFLSFNL